MKQSVQNIDYLYTPASKNLQQLLKITSFWTEGNHQSPQLIKSQLVNLTKNQNYEYALTKDGYFLKFGHKSIKMCCLYNNLYILSFSEKSFTLTSVDRAKEYYCTDPKQLKNWIELLTKFCITRGMISTRYRFINQISNGNYSKGYLIEDSKQKQLICKSFLRVDLSRVIKLRDSVIGEMLMLRPIDHPNIIKLLEIHEDSRSVYLIYQYAKGELFQEFQKKKAEKQQFTEAQVSEYMKQIFSGLKHIHSLEIMHRDIKLENILIKDGNNLLIADFGLAAKKLPKFEYKKYGTPGYIAPEVLNLKVYNEKLDVFSAGIVAYILLTSQPAFYGNTISAILTQNTAGKINFDSSKFTSLSKDAQNFLRKALCLEENVRPSAAECLELPFLTQLPQQGDVQQPQKQQNAIRLSYLGSSVLPQQINLSKAKRRSMRQYILLKQAIITEKQKTQILQQIQEQQQQEDDDSENQENLTVTESVKNIAGSFYTETKTEDKKQAALSDSDSSGESLNGESSDDEDDANLFLEDDAQHNLSSKITQLSGINIRMKR